MTPVFDQFLPPLTNAKLDAIQERQGGFANGEPAFRARRVNNLTSKNHPNQRNISGVGMVKLMESHTLLELSIAPYHDVNSMSSCPIESIVRYSMIYSTGSICLHCQFVILVRRS